MIIKGTFPKGVHYSRLLEDVVAKRYKLKRVSLSKYIPLEVAAGYLNIPPYKLYKRVMYSTELHGVYFKGEFLLHPGPLLKKLIAKGKAMITKSLKSDLLSRLPH